MLIFVPAAVGATNKDRFAPTPMGSPRVRTNHVRTHHLLWLGLIQNWKAGGRHVCTLPGFLGRRDSLPEWSKGVDSSSTSASCVGSNPTAVICQRLGRAGTGTTEATGAWKGLRSSSSYTPLQPDEHPWRRSVLPLVCALFFVRFLGRWVKTLQKLTAS